MILRKYGNFQISHETLIPAKFPRIHDKSMTIQSARLAISPHAGRNDLIGNAKAENPK